MRLLWFLELAIARQGLTAPIALPSFFTGMSPGGQLVSYNQTQTDTEFDLNDATGVTLMRLKLHWDTIETSQGVYDWSSADRLFEAADNRGMRVLFVFVNVPAWARTGGTIYTFPDDVADFAAFCTAAVNRYKARGTYGCRHWQIWNEANSVYFSDQWADIHAYCDMLNAAYTAIKAADSYATVVLSSILKGGSPQGYEASCILDVYWLTKLKEYGAQYDVVAYHAYCYPNNPAATTPTGEDSGSNLVTNGAFETNTTGWSVSNGAISRVTTDAHGGSACMQVVANGGGQVNVSFSLGAVTPGLIYNVTAWVKAITTSSTIAIQMDYYNSGFSYLDTSYWDQALIPTDEWVQLGHRYTTPAGAAWAGVTIRTDGSVPNGRTFLVDDVTFYLSSNEGHGFNRLAAVRTWMDANGESSKPIWITEYGQPTGSHATAVSAAIQAIYISNALKRAAAISGISGLILHHLRDLGTDASVKEENFGLLENDFDEKPAYDVFTAAVGGTYLTYTEKLQLIQPANQIMLLRLNETSGSTFADSSGSGNNAVVTGITLNHDTGFDGQPVPRWDGTGDYAALITAAGSSLSTDFSGTAGTVLAWAKIASAQWADGTSRQLFRLRGPGNNLIYVRKGATANILQFQFFGNAVNKLTDVTVGLTDWFMWAMTWDDANDRMRIYINGVEASNSPVTGIGTWSGGALTGTNNTLGAADTTGAEPFIGHQQYFTLWNTVLTPAEIAALIS